MRLQQYASRIRELRIGTDVQDSTVWEALAQRSSGDLLFPRLRRLHDLEVGSLRSRKVDLLLTPTLKHLALHILPGNATDAALQEVSVIFGQLKSLDITQGSPRTYHLEAVKTHFFGSPGNLNFKPSPPRYIDSAADASSALGASAPFSSTFSDAEAFATSISE